MVAAMARALMGRHLRAVTRASTGSSVVIDRWLHVATSKPNSGSSKPVLEFPVIIDPMKKDPSFFACVYSFSVSTIMVTQARYYHGFGVSQIRESARQLFVSANMALAARDVSQLKTLATPKCFAKMKKSVANNRVNLITHLDVTRVEVKQVRIGHLPVAPQYRFIQATCKFTWSLKDTGGKEIGDQQVPSAETGMTVHWVIERRLSIEDKNEDSGWRLKERFIL